MEKPYYQTDHTHCWSQGKNPACGLPRDTHTKCCLCAIPRPSQHIEKKCCKKCRNDWNDPPFCMQKFCPFHSPIEKKWEEEFVDNFTFRKLREDGELLGNVILFIRREKQLSYQAGKDAGWKEAEQWVRHMEERVYPKDVFIPLPNGGKEVYKAIDDMLKERGGRIDAVSADYARRYIKIIADDLAARSQENKEI